MKINVILTGYNRPNNLAAQHHAVLNQTLAPNKVEIWWNKGSEQPVVVPGLYGVYCNKNYKYWGRFALGLLQDCDFIAIFDDDTMPGRDWLKNCYESFNEKPGIYGSLGVKLTDNKYQDIDVLQNTGKMTHYKTGWNDKVSEITEVDLVGHSWFFPKEYLLDFWREEPATWSTGEDMHLSFACQKHSGIKTYVPPQNISKKSGSLRPEMGSDGVASWRKMEHWKQRNYCVENYVDRGWRLLHEEA
jgi:hypothetical protein